ncbi:MAG: hypothetical protein FK734_09115 [Asgard group archaeon]|nr:hypothetical protein [Asgard group archaeon]
MKIDKEKLNEVLTRDCGLSRKRSEELTTILSQSDILTEEKKEKKIITKTISETLENKDDKNKKEVKSNDIHK